MKYYLLLITLSSVVFSCSKQKTDLPNIPPEPPPINKALPTISTAAVTSITETYAISGCNLSSNGKDSIQEMGICYSTGYVTTPTVLNEKIFIKKEVNTFTDTLKKLAPNTTYYVRAYAINSVGTAYGQVISFKTQLVPPPPTTINDYDGNVYNVIKIGDQYWTKENFRGTKYNDGTSIEKVTDGVIWANLTSPAYCIYDNDPTNANIYGMLYNWYAVNTKKLAPTGWHVPNNTDFDKLFLQLDKGMEGQELKSYSYWKDDNNKWAPKRDTFKFSMLGSGQRLIFSGNFCNKNITGLLWSSSEYDTNNGYFIEFYNTKNDVLKNAANPKQYGYSIRFVKD